MGITADFAAASRPFRADVELHDVEVEGVIPKELDGTFYRVVQDQYYDGSYYENGTKTIPFDGDGSVSAFRFKDGKVSFQQKYVLTERLVAERKAGRSLFGIVKNPFTHHPCVRAVVDTAANTNVVVHANKLLAVSEGGPAYELDPNGLRTIGHAPFPDIHPTKAFTAHPHVDPETGDMIAFGYDMEGLDSPQISIYIINKDGKLTYQRDIEFYPTGGMFHDCAITRNYIVLTRMPFTVDLKDIEKPGNHQWYYDEECPAYFGLVPRDIKKPVRWFKYHNSMPIHTGASWEEDGKVYFDTTLASHNGLSFLPSRRGPNPEPKDITVNHVKFCIDPNSESDELPDPEVVLRGPCEFPRIDERFLMSKTRITWLDCFNPNEDPTRQVFQGLDTLARVDYETGEVEYFSPGPNCLVQEPAFSPRHPDAPEADGFLITMVDNMELGRNELIIQDTRDFQTVVAKVILPFRLRSAVHGNWVDATRIAGAEPYDVQSFGDIYPHIPTVGPDSSSKVNEPSKI
ncbi:isoeugenol monooxygenase [Colletotrichum nymphaeae SA-01]|uniref:Isoeugenol monooxygenase n=1 Tax=Colletotrichum nymphaeae SA-01 TaxID=1460502 RepID=A0A135TC42_9PEZI|nr:isoeugenol monooxygenase [Colletotrichum nymphaeae SA-01]